MRPHGVITALACLTLAGCGNARSDWNPFKLGRSEEDAPRIDPPRENTDCVVQSPRVQPARPRFVAEAPNGRLEVVGQGDEEILLVMVWGTPRERGLAQGRLLREQIEQSCDHLLSLTEKIMGQPLEALDKVHAATKPHTPEHFTAELEGLAEGSGLPLVKLIRANMIGEAGEFHCSLFGAWGQATIADRHVYQLRALDYETGADIQHHPAIVVHVPDEGIPFANIGYAGMIGAISGINAEGIALSEIGDSYDKANDTFDGMPFPYMLRDILQFDDSLASAIDRVRRTPRTTSLMYALGDGGFGEVRSLQTSRTLCNVFDDATLEPLTETHPRIPDVVYHGMSWDVPEYDRPLHDKLVEHYGRINAQVTIEDILPSVGTGDLQAVVYDLTALRVWVANAKASDEQGPLNAYERPFVEIDMNRVFRHAIWRAHGWRAP